MNNTYLESYFEGNGYYMLFLDSYFDAGDYKTPIKQNIDYSYDKFNFGYIKNHYVYLSYNDLETQDSYFSIFGGPKTYNYLSVDKVQQYFNANSGVSELAYYRFARSNKSTSSSRSTLTILDILGIAGGLAALISTICGVFMNSFADKLYFYQMNSDLYQVDTEKILNKENELKAFNSEIPNVQEEKIVHPLPSNENIDHHDILYYNKAERFDSKPAVRHIQQGKDTSKVASEMRSEVISKSYESLRYRRRYNYTFADILYNYLCFCK